jgi:hypothetical protein
MELNAALIQISLPDDHAHIPQQALRERVQRVVSTVPLDAFKRDKQLKAIRDQYKATANQDQLIEALDEFFIDSDLYRDVPVPKTTLEQIRAEDLHLIAYEVFG